MAYDWETEANKGGGKERIPAGGPHKLVIYDVEFTDRSGNPLCTRAGDPKIKCIFIDPKDRRAWDSYTLTDKAGFVLARLLKACGKDLGAMTRAGITLEHFTNEEWAKKLLIGLRFDGKVAWVKQEGREYEKCEVTPLMPSAAFGAPDDDIPM